MSLWSTRHVFMTESEVTWHVSRDHDNSLVWWHNTGYGSQGYHPEEDHVMDKLCQTHHVPAMTHPNTNMTSWHTFHWWHHQPISCQDQEALANERLCWRQKRCYVRSVMQLQSPDIPNRENSSQNIDDDCLRGNSFKHTFVIKSFKWPFPHLMNSLPDASQTLDTFSEIFRNYLMFVINVGAGEWLTTLLQSIRGDVTGNAEWQTVTRVM